jgi:hypothetical protein
MWDYGFVQAHSRPRKRGLYLSYNEEKNGPFDEAVVISNSRGCLTWLDKSSLRTEDLEFPMDVFVRLKGEERYYRGVLHGILHADDLAANFVSGEVNHRPASWRLRNSEPKPGDDFQSVLYISRLRQAPRPDELGTLGPPQHPAYVIW